MIFDLGMTLRTIRNNNFSFINIIGLRKFYVRFFNPQTFFFVPSLPKIIGKVISVQNIQLLKKFSLTSVTFHNVEYIAFIFLSLLTFQSYFWASSINDGGLDLFYLVSLVQKPLFLLLTWRSKFFVIGTSRTTCFSPFNNQNNFSSFWQMCLKWAWFH